MYDVTACGKARSNSFSRSEQEFFCSVRDFKKNYLKPFIEEAFIGSSYIIGGGLVWRESNEVNLMEKGKILELRTLLYDSTDAEIKDTISRMEDQEVIYVFTYNYNWDNGFEIPKLILANKKCNLSTALLMFYRADGIGYLLDKTDNKNSPQWFSFIRALYYSILNRDCREDNIEFKIPLSKVQLFKLQKKLVEQENIFIKNIEGKNLNFDL